MRKKQKEQLEKCIVLLEQLHDKQEDLLKNHKQTDAMELLDFCTKSVEAIVKIVKKEIKTEVVVISLLKEYTDKISSIKEKILEQREDCKFQKEQAETMILLSNMKKYISELPAKIEAVFLPYKASMWDSLESVWKAAEEDPECDAYVIPIPYFEKNLDGSFGKLCYEGNEFPAYVPIMDYRNFDLAERKPDIIFIHNPYDEYNRVTSVHPNYYSKNLKQYTEKLVYIPYFIREEISVEDTEEVNKMAHFCTTPAVLYADKVIVQSKAMRQVYIKVLTENNWKDRQYWEKKIVGLGSPKIDKVRNAKLKDFQIPQEWKNLIERQDGSQKKVVLYNTHLFMQGNEIFPLLKQTLNMFKERTDVVLLWRPHPLTISTLKSMNPDSLEEYMEIIDIYKSQKWGIYDESPDLHRAIVLSDGYFGSMSSVLVLYKLTGKPVLLQDIRFLLEKI